MFRVPEEDYDDNRSTILHDSFHTIMSNNDSMGGGLEGQPAEGHQLLNIVTLVKQNQAIMRIII